jgi:D-amino peptidase
MTKEAAGAARGALSAGACAVRIKDAHDSARNIIPSELPRDERVSVHRGWSGSPFSMVAGLEEGFDALAFTGYHSPSHDSGNPLSHTMSTSVYELRLNGERASEFTIHSYIAAMLSIPVIFLSGDEALCEKARGFVPGIQTVSASRGVGNSSTSMHPDEAVSRIESTMSKAVASGGKDCLISLPESFSASVKYVHHWQAFRSSFYPGASLADERTVAFETRDYMEMLRFFHFTL